MADYIKIKNGENGDICISQKVFEQIAQEATNRVSGASVSNAKGVFKLSKPVQVSFRKNGQVEVSISISIQKGHNTSDVCKNIQEEVSASLLAYCESVLFDIDIKVVSIL